jgi:hypothetical protein
MKIQDFKTIPQYSIPHLIKWGFLFYGVFIDMKRFIITEEERRSIRKMYLKEEEFDPSVDHESNIRIKSLEIDKNGVPTVVIEFWKDRVGHRSNYIDSIVKQVNNDGLTLKVDSRLGWYLPRKQQKSCSKCISI